MDIFVTLINIKNSNKVHVRW